MNEWPRLTISFNRWENWDPEGGRDLSIVKVENPEWAPSTIDSAHHYLTWGRIDMALENSPPLTMLLTMDLMLFYSSILLGYQITFLASFPLTNNSSTTLTISHSWPTLLSGSTCSSFQIPLTGPLRPSHTPPGGVLLASLAHPHGFPSYFHRCTPHSAL